MWNSYSNIKGEEKMKIIVTGGAGFVASYTIKELDRLGYDVLPLDIRESDVFGVTKCNILSRNLTKYIDEGDKILHLCAVPIWMADPRKIFRVNVEGTINLIQCALKKKAERIVGASSGAVYFGNKDIHPPITEKTPAEPNTYYGYSKLFGEQLLKNHKNEMPYIVLRYGYIYGKGDRGAINLFIKNLIQNKRPTIFWGKQQVEQVYVKDIVQANIKALETDNINKIYNIGTGVAMPLRSIYDVCSTLLNKDIEPIIKPLRPWDPPSFWYDITKSMRYLNYSPKWTLTEGIKDMLLEMDMIEI